MMRRLAVASLVFAAACGNDASAPAPPAFNPYALSANAWAGGELLVRTAVRVPDGTRIVVGSDTLALTIVDDSTVSATMPGDANGVLDVRLVGSWGYVPVGSVHVFGFHDVVTGPKVSGYSQPAGGGLLPIVLVNGDTSLIRLDLRTASVTAYPSAIHDLRCARGPGPTPTENVVVVGNSYNSGCKFAVWQLLPTPQLLLDSVHGSSRITARFNSTQWLLGGSHDICLARSVPTFSQTCTQYESMQGVRFSPRGDRAFVYYANNATGNRIPIFSAATGDTAFTVGSAQWNAGAGFTPDGDTLLLASGGLPWGNLLRSLNANTGQVYASIDLGNALSTEDVAMDPSSPYAYVLGWTSEPSGLYAHLLVLDRRTLTMIGHVKVIAKSQPTAGFLCSSCENRLFLDQAGRQLYVLGVPGWDPQATPAVIGRFDLLP